jgi:hypothetical protein
MNDIASSQYLLLSLQRALLGEVHPALRQASVEADPIAKVVRLRFEYEGAAVGPAHDSCLAAAGEVIADFPAPWRLEEQHVPTPTKSRLEPLSCIAYLRAEDASAV